VGKVVLQRRAHHDRLCWHAVALPTLPRAHPLSTRPVSVPPSSVASKTGDASHCMDRSRRSRRNSEAVLTCAGTISDWPANTLIRSCPVHSTFRLRPVPHGHTSSTGANGSATSAGCASMLKMLSAPRPLLVRDQHAGFSRPPPLLGPAYL